ncbi:MAG TPA: NADH-quinone oxidoreductase subunit J, partial [Nitrososphaerales archaeon]|nr:NADH-quinone oxidoreductase subunit J [Nitrososphaerales archaeon]
MVISLVTLIAAILSLESRELVYGAVALALSFLGVAAIFILLDALYLAMFQILVYIGSIS